MRPIISQRNSLHLVPYLFIFAQLASFRGRAEFQATFAFKLNNKRKRDLVSRERVNRSETNPHSCRAGRSTEGQREEKRVCRAQRVKVPREFLSARSAVIKMMRGHGMTIELGSGRRGWERGLCLPSLFCKTKPHHTYASRGRSETE